MDSLQVNAQLRRSGRLSFTFVFDLIGFAASEADALSSWLD